MSEPDERILRDRFKTEADALLFDDLHFDEKLQDRVRETIRRSNGTTADEQLDRRNDVHAFGKTRQSIFRSASWNKIGWFGASAAMLAVLLISAAVWLSGIGDEIVSSGPEDEFMGAIEMSPLVADDAAVDAQSGVNVLGAPDIVIVHSLEEARVMMGEAWKEPSYVAPSYELAVIEAHNVTDGKAEKVVLTYSDGRGQSYFVAVSRDGTISIEGSIDQEEAAKVEESMQSNDRNEEATAR